MCLSTVSIPEQREGIGYKVVDKPVNGIYLPQWKSFMKNGGGQSERFHDDENPNLFNSPATYQIGKITRSLHGRKTYDQNKECAYRAGIHLFKGIEDAEQEYRWYTNGSKSILECQYKRAIAEDESTIVALEVTPIREMK